MIKSVLLALMLIVFTATSANAQRLYVVGVPSEMDGPTGAVVLRTILDLFLRASEGDRIQVYDALGLQRVVDVTIPVGAANPKVRVVRVKDQIAALKAHITRSTSVRAGGSHRINFPQFCELAGASLKRAAGDTVIVVFGSPYYTDPRDEAFVFGAGYYPSDGHILANSKRSVFGTADKQHLLEGATVHFCHLTDVFETELERSAVRRFWKVYADHLGAVLVTFGPSSDVVVERALSDVRDAASQDHLDPSDTVIEMRKTVATMGRDTATGERGRGDPGRTYKAGARGAAPRRAEEIVVDRRVESVLRSVAKPKPGSLVVAAAWVAQGDAARADVDLYFRARPDAEELNFNNVSSDDGKYLRDIRSAQSALDENEWGASWEAVEYNDVNLDHATCWLNLYCGCSGKIEGVVRLLMGERIATVPYSFPALVGDQAAGRNMRDANPCWIEIRLDELTWTDAP